MDQQSRDKRLHELEEKWLANTITPEEAAEYADWYNKNQDLPVAIPASFARSEADLEARMLAGIQQRAGIQAPVRRITRYWPAAAAAAVLLGLAIATYYLVFSTSSKQELVQAPPSPTPVNDVLPGGNKATLTLDNGETIVLEDAANGVLASQGRARVIKKASGELVYQNAPDDIAKPVYHTMRTPRGGQYQLRLPDGSQVWLNAASSLRYPTVFSGTERRVSISGEAYFEVSKDAAKPFIVEIERKGEVKVLGTHFNINAYEDEPTVQTTLLEGSVELSNGYQQLLLKPGQLASYGSNRQIRVDQADLESVMAWKNGYFVFKNATTEMIMRQAARWYDAEVVYEGDVRHEKFVGQVPRAENASKLLEVLALTQTVKFTIEDKKIIVRPYK